MTNEKKNELVNKLIAFAAENGDTLQDVPLEIMQAIAAEVAEFINPVNPALIGFYIAVFEMTAQALRGQYPREAELADDLKQEINCCGIIYPNRKNK